jgi:hypothetical protein
MGLLGIAIAKKAPQTFDAGPRQRYQRLGTYWAAT